MNTMTWTKVPGGGWSAEPSNHYSYLAEGGDRKWTLTVYYQMPTLDAVSHKVLELKCGSLKEAKAKAAEHRRIA